VVVPAAGDPGEIGPLLEQHGVEGVSFEELAEAALLGLDFLAGHGPPIIWNPPRWRRFRLAFARSGRHPRDAAGPS
jgi:hypothetical protein